MNNAAQNGAEIPFVCEQPRTARYVSLDIDTSMSGVTEAFLQLADVAVEDFTSGEGAALPVHGKNTTQSTTWGVFPSDKAIDGRTNTFSHTDVNDSHPWWLLDLGSKHCLGRINVTLRKHPKGYRFIGAILPAGLSPNFTENHPCGSPATSQQSKNGAQIPFLCEPPRTARYVSLDIDTSMPGVNPIRAILQLAELTVEEYTSGECTAKTRSTVFTKTHQGALIGNSEPLATKMVKSLSRCAGYCTKQAECVSFDYAKGSGQCRLHGLASADAELTPSQDCSVYDLE